MCWSIFTEEFLSRGVQEENHWALGFHFTFSLLWWCVWWVRLSVLQWKSDVHHATSCCELIPGLQRRQSARLVFLLLCGWIILFSVAFLNWITYPSLRCEYFLFTCCPLFFAAAYFGYFCCCCCCVLEHPHEELTVSAPLRRPRNGQRADMTVECVAPCHIV